MSAAASRSAVLLDEIAATLGVPVESFTARVAPPASDTAPAAHIATLLFDPDGRRLAAAYSALPPQFRRSLAAIAEAIQASASTSSDDQQPRAEGRS